MRYLALLLFGLLLAIWACGGQHTQPLTITTVDLTVGVEGANYSTKLEASGGVPPYHWAVQGDLPSGLTLNSDTGEIAGNLGFSLTDGEHPKPFTFWVIVTDSR